MGGTDDFSTDDLAFVLSQHKMIFYSNDRSEEIKSNASRAGLNSMRLSNIRSSDIKDEEGDDYDT